MENAEHTEPFSEVFFLVPDSQLNNDLDTGLPALAVENHASNSPKQVDKSGIGVSSMDRKGFGFSSGTDNSEKEDQAVLLAVDTLSEWSDSSKNETIRNTTVIEKVSKKKPQEQQHFLTPSEKIGSLQFSGEQIMVTETIDLTDVTPVPPAWETMPMIIPDSPCMNETDEEDEEDNEIFFNLHNPTINLEHNLAKHSPQTQSDNRESQSLHLKLTPSQGDALETQDSDEFQAEDAIGKAGPETGVSQEINCQDMQLVTGKSDFSASIAKTPSSKFIPESLSKRNLPSSSEVKAVESSQDSLSVFRRVRSENTSPHKHSLILDDSDECPPEVEAPSISGKSSKRSQSQKSSVLYRRTGPGRSLTEDVNVEEDKPENTSSPNLSLKKDVGWRATENQCDPFPSAGSGQRQVRNSSPLLQAEVNISDDASVMDVDADQTLSYELCVGRRSSGAFESGKMLTEIEMTGSLATNTVPDHTSVATVSDKGSKSVSSACNVMLSRQEQHVDEAKLTATVLKHEKLSLPSQEVECVLSADPGTQFKKVSKSDARKVKIHSEMGVGCTRHAAAENKDFSKITVGVEDTSEKHLDPLSSCFSDKAMNNEPSTGDLYTFHPSQSQSVTEHPLTEQSMGTCPRQKTPVVKYMRKVFKKKALAKQEDSKSSSDPGQQPERKIQKRLIKQKQVRGSARKSLKEHGVDVPGERTRKSVTEHKVDVPVDSTRKALLEPQLEHPLINVKQVETAERFTLLQTKTMLSKPCPSASTTGKNQRPPKEGVKESSSHPRPQSHKSDGAGSTNHVQAESAESSKDSSDSFTQGVEKTTVRRMLVIHSVIQEVTKIVVYNSKGEVVREAENTVEVSRVHMQPDIMMSETTSQRTVAVPQSPLPCSSSLSTGDYMADISSLSKTSSFGSKAGQQSSEAASTCESFPTPAQRQRSLDKAEIEKVPKFEENRRNSSDLPGVPTVKNDGKLSSSSCNTGRELFSTPNQSSIEHVDSQIHGQEVCSSNNTSASQLLVSPNLGGHQPLVATGLKQTANSENYRERTGSRQLPSAQSSTTAQISAVSLPATAVTDLNSRSASASATRRSSQDRVVHAETPQRQELGQTLRAKRLLVSSTDSDDKTGYGQTAESATSMPNPNSRKQTVQVASSEQQTRESRSQVAVTKGADEVSTSSGCQSTGFSVLGAPALPASGGDSEKERATSAMSKSRSDSTLSPQVSLQGGGLPSVLSMAPQDYKSKPITGAKVLGKWKDGFYYPGILSKVDPSNKKYMIKFDDGSQSAVKVNEIILAGELPVGQSVMVMTTDNEYEPAMVMGHSEQRDEDGSLSITYHVERDDGVKQTCGRRHLILSEGQAACLLSDEDMRISLEVPASSKPGDISLENLVEGKRHTKPSKVLTDREQPMEAEATSAPPVRTEATSSSRKRKLPPPKTSTPTSKPKQQCQEETRTEPLFMAPEISPLGGAVASPSRSSAKTRSGKRGKLFETDGSKTRLFEGMMFVLTHVEKSEEERAREKKLLRQSSLDSSAAESSDHEPQHTAFIKGQLSALITDGGGQIFESFDEVIKQPLDCCYLVAAEHHRTVKYLQALAAGITIVSHEWILNSVSLKKLQSVKNYLLPAGISIEKRKLIERTRGCPELATQTVMIVSSNLEFLNVWKSILKIAKAAVVTRFPTRASKTDPGVDVVVSDSTCPASVIRRCQQLEIPVVSSDWVAQCLIDGHLVDFTGKEQYRHDFSAAPH